jgi:predicted transcriptional regulator
LAVDFESFNDVLKHPIRRKIIIALGNNKTLSYVELLNITEASNTGKFNYHLKILGDLIEKDTSGKYSLTEKGHLSLEFLQKFPEKPPNLQPT